MGEQMQIILCSLVWILLRVMMPCVLGLSKSSDIPIRLFGLKSNEYLVIHRIWVWRNGCGRVVVKNCNLKISCNLTML